VTHRDLDHGSAVFGPQLEQRQRHAPVVVQVALGLSVGPAVASAAATRSLVVVFPALPVTPPSAPTSARENAARPAAARRHVVHHDQRAGLAAGELAEARARAQRRGRSAAERLVQEPVPVGVVPGSGTNTSPGSSVRVSIEARRFRSAGTLHARWLPPAPRAPPDRLGERASSVKVRIG